MPHLNMETSLLDLKYPSLKVPDELDIDETKYDIHDLVYQRGLQEAQGITTETAQMGRMKYVRNRSGTMPSGMPSRSGSTTTTTTTTTTKAGVSG